MLVGLYWFRDFRRHFQAKARRCLLFNVFIFKWDLLSTLVKMQIWDESWLKDAHYTSCSDCECNDDDIVNDYDDNWLPNSPSFREFSEWNDIQDLRCCHWHWAILTINHFLFQIQMNMCFRRFQGFVHLGLNIQGFYECRGIVGLHLMLMYIDDEPEVRRGEINCLQSCEICNEKPSN